MKKFLKPKAIALLVIPLVILGVAFKTFWKTQQATASNYLTAPVTQGNIRYKVSATGTLQAVTTVQVGSQVSGRIQNLYVDFNSVVRKGQLLAQIDPATYQAALDRAKAEVATAQAAIKSAEATMANRRAELINAKANAEASRVAETDAKRALTRSLELSQAGLIPARDLETTQAAADQAAARLEQAKAQIQQGDAQIRSATAQLDQAKAQVQQAQASLTMADVNLKYTTITSPIDGVVIERNVDAGQTVAASLQAPTLFLIAQDLTRMQVLAAIDEADIGSISENARVEFAVDSFPGEKFNGKIHEIRLNAKTVQNVVTYSVVIAVDNPQLKLRPGMTANISIIIAELRNTLKIPNAALRFRPNGGREDVDKVSGPTSDKGPSSAGGPEGARMTGNPASVPGGPGASPEGRMRSPRGKGNENMNGDRKSNKPQTELSVQMDPGDKVRFRSASVGREFTQMIWTLDDAKKQLQPHQVKLGITDGMDTAMLEGDLKPGDQIVIGETVDPDKRSNGGTASPFGRPGMPGASRPSGGRGGR